MRRQQWGRWSWLVYAAIALGCGGGSSGSNSNNNGADGAAGEPGSNGLLACDIRPACGSKGSERVCIASTGYGQVAGDSTGTKTNCMVAGGFLGSTCDLAGAVAGCRGAGAGSGSYITYTYWYYSGTVDDVLAKCPSPMTVVMPEGGLGTATDGGAGSCPDAGASGGIGDGGAGTFTRGPLTGVTSMSAGIENACAVIAGGKVVCWGVNQGFLGTTTYAASLPEPILMPGISGATAITFGGQIGSDFACVILQDGTVTCWGAMSGADHYPAVIPGLTGATALATGDQFACALAGGEVWCWGSNIWSQLGFPGSPTSSSSTPVKIPGLANVTAIGAASRHACAVMGGAAWCWGENSYSESGVMRPAGMDRIATPAQVANLTNVVSVTPAAGLSYAVLADGSVWCWGQCAITPIQGSATPTKLTAFSDAVSLTVGRKPYCALQKGGTVQCPRDAAAVAGLTGVKAISGLGNFTCVLVGDGVQCWGVNDNGQLGQGTAATTFGGTTQPTTTPAPVIGLGPCCGGGNTSFSTGLPATTRVADLTAAQFQTLCTKVRDDTDGLDQYCKVLSLGGLLAFPASVSDADLKAMCQTYHDSCVTITPKYSSSTCAAVTTSAACTVHVDEVEACMNEQTQLGKANGPQLPACSAVTRAALDAIPDSLLMTAPRCGAIGTCNQIFSSP